MLGGYFNFSEIHALIMRFDIITKLLSYFYPITTKIRTEKNGIVELTYSNGRKILDSSNANYSYGSLQRILKFGLEKIEFTKVNDVLLLNLGNNSVIHTLRNDFGFTGKITAVEIDKTIIDIAMNEFELMLDANLETIHTDATEYVKNNAKKSDLLIVDIYIDAIVPSDFYTTQFWNNALQLINKNGYFIFNACIFNENSEKQMSDLLNYLRTSNSIQLFNKVEGTNTLIVGTKN